LRKKNLKLLGILGLALVFALVMASCGGNGTTIDEETLDTTQTRGAYGFTNNASSDVTVTVTSDKGKVDSANSTTSVSDPAKFTLKTSQSAMFTDGPDKVTFTAKSSGKVKFSANGGGVMFYDE
jgi:hypothetical protein